ncbi:MAG: hypothetical protein LQ350_007249 [Teloschistes chrysophthalmus]|nr:MAG: hypothetical protein LQ350_007249 [Niorma chrysophthalma]
MTSNAIQELTIQLLRDRFMLYISEVGMLDKPAIPITSLTHDEKHLEDQPPLLAKALVPDITTTELLKLLLYKLISRSLHLSSHLALSFVNEQWCYKPSELLPAWWTSSETFAPKLHPTSWLDGLRGVAALIVFFHHSSQIWLLGIRPGWGSSPESHHIIQLPLLRIFYSGSAMVCLFFVISGYVLSTKPLRLAQQGRHEDLLANLASSTFRRGPRLYLPCIVSTLLTAILVMTGAFVEEGVERQYPHAETMAEQIRSWFHATLSFLNPFSMGTLFEPNLWTIPNEFLGSLMVFLCCLGLSRCRKSVRLGCLVSFLAYWLWFGYWPTALFLGGMLLADLRINWIPHTNDDCTTISPKQSSRREITFGLLALLAVYLLSIPEYLEAATESIGYKTLSTTLTPLSWRSRPGPGRWWPCLSSLLLVAIIDHAGPNSILQHLFTNKFSQYLGRISFSFYLCHGLTLYTIGLRTVRFFFGIIGDKTDFQYGCSLTLGAMVVIPLLFWISDVFTVVVDRGAVLLSRRLMSL